MLYILSLRWLKPVLTLERNIVIRRIDTMYNSSSFNSNVMVPYQHQYMLKNLVIFVTWQQESPAKTPHILALAAHISKRTR